MAISRVTTWTAGQVLTASALNGEFDNVLDNALSWLSELTGQVDAGSNDILNVNALRLQEGTEPPTPGADNLSVYAFDLNGTTTLRAKSNTGAITDLGYPPWSVLTTSLSEDTLTGTTSHNQTVKTISSLSVATTDGLLIVGSFRKDTGGSNDTVYLGLKINSTIVRTTAAAPGSSGVTANDNTTGSGHFRILIWQQITSYLQSAYMQTFYGFGAGANTTAGFSVAFPGATITDIEILGKIDKGGTTLGVADVTLYTMRPA